ncbi:MAG: VWA domain-containing protein [Candidatus Omnitrophica bacterium]|nr:VWA domain-containing protein [Candidatus Omnitrophota bacterium]
MRFAEPWFFLLTIPALIFFILYLFSKIGKDAVIRFSSLALVKKTGAKKIRFSRLFPALLRLAALVLLVSALARPQTGTGEEKTTEHVVDIMLALDISGSMATLDFEPDNRLVAAKLEAKRFIEGRHHDRIGLVVFAGESLTQCPLTIDHRAVLTLLDKIQLGMVQDGTAIGVGLANAVNRLKDSEAKSKVVVLLTDGVNNAGEIDPPTAADLAKQFHVRVYTIGVGKEGVSILPVQDPQFGTRLLRVETQIDEKMLDLIARKTGGIFFRAQDTRALRDIFHEIDRLEKTEITVERSTRYDERFFWFLWPALWVLLCEILWTNGIRVKIP